MSDQWHQHLNNLTLWEQIDRFFNPGKYSCSTVIVSDFVWQFALTFFVVSIATLAIIYIVTHVQWRDWRAD